MLTLSTSLLWCSTYFHGLGIPIIGKKKILLDKIIYKAKCAIYVLHVLRSNMCNIYESCVIIQHVKMISNHLLNVCRNACIQTHMCNTCYCFPYVTYIKNALFACSFHHMLHTLLTNVILHISVGLNFSYS